MSKFDKIYGKSPIWLQNMLVSVYGFYWRWLRFTGSYQSHLQGYITREFLSAKEWQAFQQSQLKNLLSICLKSAPIIGMPGLSLRKKQRVKGFSKGFHC